MILIYFLDLYPNPTGCVEYHVPKNEYVSTSIPMEHWPEDPRARRALTVEEKQLMPRKCLSWSVHRGISWCGLLNLIDNVDLCWN